MNIRGADKLSAELHAKVVSLTHGIKMIGLRFFNVYGRDLHGACTEDSDVVSSFVTRLMAGKAPTVFGDGEQVRDFVYIDDAVRFLLAAMDCELEGHKVFNVCSGEAVSVSQLARSIMSILGCNIPIVYQPPRKGDIRGFAGDSTLASKLLGVSARYRIADGLYQYIQCQRQFAGSIRGGLYSASDSSHACFLR